MINIIDGKEKQIDISQLLDYINGFLLLNDVNVKKVMEHKSLILKFMEKSIYDLEDCSKVNLYQTLESPVLKLTLKDSLKWKIKKIIKKATYWYMKDIEKQQNKFNQQVVMVLNNQLNMIKILLDMCD